MESSNEKCAFFYAGARFARAFLEVRLKIRTRVIGHGRPGGDMLARSACVAPIGAAWWQTFEMGGKDTHALLGVWPRMGSRSRRVEQCNPH